MTEISWSQTKENLLSTIFMFMQVLQPSLKISSQLSVILINYNIKLPLTLRINEFLSLFKGCGGFNDYWLVLCTP